MHDEIALSGYVATKEWNGEMNKKVGHRQPNHEALYVLWLFSLIESILYLIVDSLAFVCKIFRLSS